METNEVFGQKLTFKGPSGFEYTIREQNGADDDILSNARNAHNLMNISYFIAAIVVNTNATSNHKLTAMDALKLPILDRYCILLQSRIFSLGETLEFVHDWGGNVGKIEYEQNLEEFLFDYSELPTEEILNSKPDAIPFYPNQTNIKDIVAQLPTGKNIKFDLLTGEGEQKLMESTLANRTRNQEFIARNLCLQIDGKWEPVKDFFGFTAKEMVSLRKVVTSNDPIWPGVTHIINPETEESIPISILGIPGFFYPEEI